MTSRSKPRECSQPEPPRECCSEARGWLLDVLSHPAALAGLLCDPEDGTGPARRVGQWWARTVPGGPAYAERPDERLRGIQLPTFNSVEERERGIVAAMQALVDADHRRGSIFETPVFQDPRRK